IQQGKPTIINNFWQEGGLNILGTLACHTQKLPPNFIDHLLETRLALAPAYTRAAVEHSPQDVASHLETFAQLEDTPAAFACFDWKLHRALALASGNPVYTLILNGFTKLYIQAAQLYFSNPKARAASRAFYAALLSDVRRKNASKAEKLSKAVMRESIDLWKQTTAQHAAQSKMR
ncbi:MAG: FCD domain-containing protein, partial [Thermodesulfobacteriota bacterium]